MALDNFNEFKLFLKCLCLIIHSKETGKICCSSGRDWFSVQLHAIAFGKQGPSSTRVQRSCFSQVRKHWDKFSNARLKFSRNFNSLWKYFILLLNSLISIPLKHRTMKFIHFTQWQCKISSHILFLLPLLNCAINNYRWLLLLFVRYLAHIRVEDKCERAGGFQSNVACYRALQDSFCGLFL